ncbi:hypothetical protein DC083_08820 [Ignatzschineria ureiclastica]|uniref:Glutathionylspermidine synthase pre-ATP-grasp-like domain-containing protein n=1 Tax=Ignatzschineria ureiclastica TaxID=472582 RepID=A0A2U2ACW9_9GAMM|nr:glutathionylspermidine synthase family protein [Ignatzschineria ureiclastica]PWD80409.1 hypothetical protein DC083_08820 [Ignatzschineria ureiclastica]GGZ99710.1 hypothetical protein GCM10007162_14900 [Ignatzschineria ureiclastica]
MKRVAIEERPHWQAQAEEYGFNFHTMYGERYWCEDYYYQFGLKEIELIEDATEELHQMALAAVDRVVKSERLLEQFQIPPQNWRYIRETWEQGAPSLYGRFDFAYDGAGHLKMLEYNADTPTSLYESAFFQWLWLEDQIEAKKLPMVADQFNSIQEKLISRFGDLRAYHNVTKLFFSCCEDSEEDRGTVEYLQDCAIEAGLETEFLYIEEIGINSELEYTDLQDEVIQAIFKLYPWEFMLGEDFANYLDMNRTLWLEPAWKAILSNKALLPLLWEMFPNHHYLLPAYFANDPKAKTLTNYVKKPLFSREGANVEIVENGEILESADGPYGVEGSIIQEYVKLPVFDGSHVVLGSWIVGDSACGLSVREDHSRITQDLSRFYPHVILS